MMSRRVATLNDITVRTPGICERCGERTAKVSGAAGSGCHLPDVESDMITSSASVPRVVGVVLAVSVSVLIVGCGTTGTPCGGGSNLACAAGLFCKYETGDCGGETGLGVCEPTPNLCTEIFAPVCGCDGNTYGNECFARAASVNVQSQGECAGGQ